MDLRYLFFVDSMNIACDNRQHLSFSPFLINPPMNLVTNGRPAEKNTWTFPWSENQVLVDLIL